MGRGQGDHVGTGQPIAFVCPVLRRAKFSEDRTHGDYEWHRPARTGLTRAARTRGHYTRAVGRMLDVEHEYICQCGHRGWTKHSDILRFPLGCPDGGRCHHGDICNTVQKCFRTGCCEPLSGVFPNDEWPRAYASE